METSDAIVVVIFQAIGPLLSFGIRRARLTQEALDGGHQLARHQHRFEIERACQLDEIRDLQIDSAALDVRNVTLGQADFPAELALREVSAPARGAEKIRQMSGR